MPILHPHEQLPLNRNAFDVRQHFAFLIENVEGNRVRNRQETPSARAWNSFFFQSAQRQNGRRIHRADIADTFTMRAFFKLGFGQARVEALTREPSKPNDEIRPT